jgi:hypothetical protein
LIRNSILRQVADSWPSVKARLATLSEEILNSYTRQSYVALILNPMASSQRGSEHKLDISTQRIFLSKLLSLIAVFCECSGDFMANRFRNDVWPIMARQFGNLLQKEGKIISRNTSEDSKSLLLVEDFESSSNLSLPLSTRTTTSNTDFHWNDSERQLVLSMLRCINRTMKQEECGKTLESILVPAGAMLLPLLGCDNDIELENLTMDCLKTILGINYDVLWRPLLELSGVGIPPCRLSTTQNIVTNRTRTAQLAKKQVFSSTSNKRDQLIVIRSQELLAYIDTLPEQLIE